MVRRHHPGADRRAPAPVARADRRGAEGVRRGAERGPRARSRGSRFVTILPELCAELPAPARACRRSRAAKARSAAAWQRPAGRSGKSSSRRWRRSPAPSPTNFWRQCAPPRRSTAPMSTTAATSPSSQRPGKRSTSPSPATFRSAPCRRRSGTIRIRHGDGVGGIATSGARGRSFSLGIADSVTVLAEDAATADAAATLIANAVDCDDRRSSAARRTSSTPTATSATGWSLSRSGGLRRRSVDAALAAGLSRARALPRARSDRRRRADAAGRDRDALSAAAPHLERIAS